MRNKLLGYLLGSIIVLSTGFITSYVDAQSCGCEEYKDDLEIFNLCEQSCRDKQQTQQTEEKECKDGCCGIKLNTNFPGIGTCISFGNGSNPTNVFPKMLSGLTGIIMALILVVCFILIIVAGIMRAGAGEDSSQKTKAKNLIKKVAITVLLLGFSGVILRLINPNFFG